VYITLQALVLSQHWLVGCVSCLAYETMRSSEKLPRKESKSCSRPQPCELWRVVDVEDGHNHGDKLSRKKKQRLVDDTAPTTVCTFGGGRTDDLDHLPVTVYT